MGDKATVWLNSQPLKDYLGDHGYLKYFTNKQGLRICEYYWPSLNTARGVVVVIHGSGAYMTYEYTKFVAPRKPGVYEGSWIEQLNVNGYSVYGMDLQGCGRSEGLRGYVERFQDHVDDVVQATLRVKQSNSADFARPPVFLLGASLGGHISLRVSMAVPDVVKGVILLAPMLSLEKVAKKGWNPYLRHIGSLLSWLTPTWLIVKTNKNTMFPELQEAWDNDPATWHYPTRARVGNEYLNACAYLMSSLAEIHVPFIVFHSEQDTMTDPDGSKALYEKSGSSDKTLRLLTNMWHILVKEKGNAEVLEEVISWLNAHTHAPN